ncbi:hypothetical protein LINGRAHAP2_LOCUS31975 [Linum grandiflorum]
MDVEFGNFNEAFDAAIEALEAENNEVHDKKKGYWRVMVVTPEGLPSYELLNCNEVVASALPNGLRIVVTCRGVGGITAAHWAAFVTNRLNDKALENRDQNKLNRADQLLNHGGGSRPYARVKEKRALELDHEPCRVDVWVEANKRANGSFRQTRAGEIAAHIQELNDQGISCDDINSDCLTQALGTKERKKRICTMGHGITPTKGAHNDGGQNEDDDDESLV